MVVSIFLFAQAFKPQSSSLIKIPLYFTEGSPTVIFPDKAKSSFLGIGFTSAHHVQGETPAMREISNSP